MQAKNFVICVLFKCNSAKKVINTFNRREFGWGAIVETDPLIYLFLEKVQMFTKTNSIIGKDILSGFELKISR